MLLQLHQSHASFVPDVSARAQLPSRFRVSRRVAAWTGFLVVAAAVTAAAWVEFSRAVTRDIATPPAQMLLLPPGSGQMNAFPDGGAAVDPFLEQKRAAKLEELPAQF
jgi:hypothetical protein